MKTITSAHLCAAESCERSVAVFERAFPRGLRLRADVRLLRRLERLDLDWRWAEVLLPPAAQAEYDRVATEAYAAFRRVYDLAYAAYKRATAPLLDEYLRLCRPASEPGQVVASDRDRAAAWATFERASSPALAECTRAWTPAWDECSRACFFALVRLLREAPG